MGYLAVVFEKRLPVPSSIIWTEMLRFTSGPTAEAWRLSWASLRMTVASDLLYCMRCRGSGGLEDEPATPQEVPSQIW